MSKLVYFLSDIHLGASYIKNPIDAERRVNRFLDSIKDKASEIYLMGDILDYWYEYCKVVPKGYTRFFGKIAELSDMGIKIYWFIGNHDIWIYDYLPQELGITVIDGIEIKDIMGKRFFLNHGDAVGKQKLSFRIMRKVFRNKVCQFVFSMLPSCITIPFAHKWSSASRASEDNTCQEITKKYIDNILAFTKEHARVHTDIDYYIFGHIHEIADEKISKKARCILLGEWISKFSYAVYDGNDVKILKFMN